MKITFDREHHLYRAGLECLPSVTYILRRTGVCPPIRPFVRKAMDRGRAVHRAIELFEEGDLDFGSVDQGIAGWLNSYLAWSTKHPMRRIKSEVILGSAIHRYAGTADRIGSEQFGEEWRPVIVDFKTGPEEAWHEVQLVAYGVTYFEMKHQMPGLLAVYLKKNGDYKCTAISPAIATWEAVLQTFDLARERHMAELGKGDF